MPHHRGRLQLDLRARRLTLVLLVSVVALLFVSPGLAQLPPAPEARVAVTAAQTQRVIEPGACASYQVTVANEAQPVPPPPVPAPQDEVTIQLGNPSPGWRLSPNPAGTFQLPRGESRTVSVGLCAGEDVPRGTNGNVLVTATLRDSTNSLAEPAEDSVMLTARIEEGSLLGIGDSIPMFVVWVALGAVGLLLATAVIARRKPGAAVSLECREPSKEVPAGRGTSFPVRISNEGRSRDVVSLTTSPVPRGWDTFLPVVDVALEPAEDQTVWISVKSPDNAQPGDHVAVKVFARSSAAGGEQASLELLTTVRNTGSESAWGGGVSAGGGDEEERSVYGPEGEGGRAVGVKRRRA